MATTKFSILIINEGIYAQFFFLRLYLLRGGEVLFEQLHKNNKTLSAPIIDFFFSNDNSL